MQTIDANSINRTIEVQERVRTSADALVVGLILEYAGNPQYSEEEIINGVMYALSIIGRFFNEERIRELVKLERND